MGKSWHRACWYCSDCQNPFGADGFFNVDGMPYCPKCKRNKRMTFAPGSSAAKQVAELNNGKESSLKKGQKGKEKK